MIVVGDVRDGAVARMVLGAAEAGRKVLAIMTGLYATQAITRFISLIPPDERETAFSQLAAVLEGVIAQRLAKTRDGKLRPAVEVFRGGAAVVGADPGEPSQRSETISSRAARVGCSPWTSI